MTPMMYFADANLSENIEIIAKYGADPLKKNTKGETAARIAFNKAVVMDGKSCLSSAIKILENKI